MDSKIFSNSNIIKSKHSGTIDVFLAGSVKLQHLEQRKQEEMLELVTAREKLKVKVVPVAENEEKLGKLDKEGIEDPH